MTDKKVGLFSLRADNSADAEDSADFLNGILSFSDTYGWSAHCCTVLRRVPIGASTMLLSRLGKGATLRVYQGFDHGMGPTYKHQINEELLAFIKA